MLTTTLGELRTQGFGFNAVDDASFLFDAPVLTDEPVLFEEDEGVSASSIMPTHLMSGHGAVYAGRPEQGFQKSFKDLSYRAIDGSDGHDEGYGTAGTILTTVAGHDYGDGVSAPAGSGRPGAREISNMIFAQGGMDVPSAISASNFLWMWGQFLDHDITLVLEGAAAFNIAVPTGDAYFDPDYTGAVEIPFHRSLAADGTSTDNGIRVNMRMKSRPLSTPQMYMVMTVRAPRPCAMKAVI